MRLSPQLYPELEKERILMWMIALSLGFHVILFSVFSLIPGVGFNSKPFSPVYTVDLVSFTTMDAALERADVTGSLSKQGEIRTVVPVQRARKIPVSPVDPSPTPEPAEAIREVSVVKPQEVLKSRGEPAPEKVNVDQAVKKIEKKKQVETQRAEQEGLIAEKIRNLSAARTERDTVPESASRPAVSPALSGQVSPGGPIGEETVGAAEGSGPLVGLRLQIYKTNIWNRVRNNWSYPEIMAVGVQLEALVRLRVRGDGTILDSQLARKSGNHLFDQSVMRAVKLSDPLPPFPEGYVKSFEDIELRFNLSDMGRT